MGILNKLFVFDGASLEIENSNSTSWIEFDVRCIAHAAGSGIVSSGELTGCKVGSQDSHAAMVKSIR